jgi:hypothetical protein
LRIYPNPEKLAESDFEKTIRHRHAFLMLCLKAVISLQFKEKDDKHWGMEETVSG